MRSPKIKPDGEAIRRLRLAKGFSLEGLAECTRISLKTIRNLETNPRHECNSSTISELAEFFRVDRAALIARAATAPRTLTTTAEIIRTNIEIASAAKEILLCAGSRSRDAAYMQAIETALKTNPTLIHYRVMAHPPFKAVFQQHLLRLLEIRNPADRSQGHKTIHVGIYRDVIHQPECAICANETRVLFVLPSINSLGQYDTAIVFDDPRIIDGVLNFGKNLYHMSQPLESCDAVLSVGLVPNGDYYE